jgi:hypothetical protein
MLARLPLSAAMPHRSTLTSRGLADAEPDVDAPTVQCTCTGATEHLSLLVQTGSFDVLSENGLQSSSCSPSSAKLTRRNGFRQTLLVSKIEGNCTICQQEQSEKDSREEIAISMCTNDVELCILCLCTVDDNRTEKQCATPLELLRLAAWFRQSPLSQQLSGQFPLLFRALLG